MKVGKEKKFISPTSFIREQFRLGAVHIWRPIFWPIFWPTYLPMSDFVLLYTSILVYCVRFLQTYLPTPKSDVICGRPPSVFKIAPITRWPGENLLGCVTFSIYFFKFSQIVSPSSVLFCNNASENRNWNYWDWESLHQTTYSKTE